MYIILYAYISWVKEGKPKYFYLIGLSTLICGVMTHYVFPLIFLLFLFSILFKEKVNLKLFLVIPAIAAFAFLINMLYVTLLGGTISHLSSEGAKYIDISLLIKPSFYSLFLKRFMAQIGFIPLVLSSIWLWVTLKEKFNYKDKDNFLKNALILLLFVYGISWFIVMPGAVYEHDYFLYFLVPPLIISSALGLRMLPRSAYVPILTLFLLFSVYGTIGMHGNSGYHEDIRDVSRYMQTISQSDDLILATVFEREAFIKYYADRSVLTATNISEFGDSLTKYRPKIVLLSDEEFDEKSKAEDLLLEKDYYQLNDSWIPERLYVWKKRD